MRNLSSKRFILYEWGAVRRAGCLVWRCVASLLMIANWPSPCYGPSFTSRRYRERAGMAFVVQCPFCKLKAKVPDRALGGVGHCPRCANPFSLAAAEDGHLPEAIAQNNTEPATEMTVGAAIAVATAVAKANDPIPVNELADVGFSPARSDFRPASARCCDISAERSIPSRQFRQPAVRCCFSAQFIGSCNGPSRHRDCVLNQPNVAGSCRCWACAAGFAMLVVSGLFPAALGPDDINGNGPNRSQWHCKRCHWPTPPGLAELPEWVDANATPSDATGCACRWFACRSLRRTTRERKCLRRSGCWCASASARKSRALNPSSEKSHLSRPWTLGLARHVC